MNKAVTDGVVFMPSPFVDGLGVWSSQDGTPGSDTYDGSGNGAFVPADQDFGGALEIVKTASTTKLRYMGETPIFPGCYLKITARVKAISGALPNVRIAGWPGQAGGAKLTGVSEAGPTTSLTSYGQVVEVSAIVGTGPRLGVDLVWPGAAYGHFGLDLTGANGGVVRVDDIVIEDVTNVFIRDMLGVVDVRDYGAVGDGIADDAAAFEAADADAQGREVLVSAGTYRLGSNVTIQNQIRFEGTVLQDETSHFIFQKNFDYATYYDAFGDEELAFKKAFQALLNFADHESLDLNGRRIYLSEPCDLYTALNNKPRFEQRRVIRNGQLEPIHGAAWDTTTVTAQGTYSPSNGLELTNVTNIGSIEVGSLITGPGVGREVYVASVNVGQNRIGLSNRLFDAEGTQQYTFTRFRYLLEATGFEKLSAIEFEDIDFSCEGQCSGVLLATDGNSMKFRDCQFNRPKDRAISSPGDGCTGIDIFNCIFNSNEQAEPVANRKTICFNINRNDATVRNNRAARFLHFGIMSGNGNMITGNHWFNGDDTQGGVRPAGLILSSHNCASTVTANYCDNSFIEITNEHDNDPDSFNEYTFGGLSITGNLFIASNVAPWFSWIVATPYGNNHSIQGLSVTGNVFRTYGGNVDRVERIDTTYADMDRNTMRNIVFDANAFNGIDNQTRNPYSDVFTQNTAASTWTIDTGSRLPFGGWTRTIESVVVQTTLRDAGGQPIYVTPQVAPVDGTDPARFNLIWPEPVSGRVRFVVRMDNPA